MNELILEEFKLQPLDLLLLELRMIKKRIGIFIVSVSANFVQIPCFK